MGIKILLHVNDLIEDEFGLLPVVLTDVLGRMSRIVIVFLGLVSPRQMSGFRPSMPNA